MTAILEQNFAPVRMTVEDESARHAGHAGASSAGETHYNVTLVSERFTALSRVERSRIVHNVLKGEFEQGLHALSLSLRSPNEK